MKQRPSGYRVGSGRYRIPARSTRKSLFIVHDSESSDTSYQSLMNFMATPATADNVASYHGLTDGLADWTCLWDDCNIVAPFSAPPTNDYAFHVCIPGRASQTLEEWTDPISLNHIKGMARAIVELCVPEGIPLRYVPADELKQLALQYPDVNDLPKLGYTSHNNVRIAWGKTTHTDPGPNFPWPLLQAEIDKLHAPVDPPLPITPQNYPEGFGMRRFIFKWETQTAVMICHTDLMTYWCSFDNAEQYYTAVMHPDFLQDMRGQPENSLGIPFILHAANWSKLPRKTYGDVTLL